MVDGQGFLHVRCRIPGEVTVTDVPDDDLGGDPACWMHRVCAECGRLADEDPPTRCPSCGAQLEVD